MTMYIVGQVPSLERNSVEHEQLCPANDQHSSATATPGASAAARVAPSAWVRRRPLHVWRRTPEGGGAVPPRAWPRRTRLLVKHRVRWAQAAVQGGGFWYERASPNNDVVLELL